MHEYLSRHSMCCSISVGASSLSTPCRCIMDNRQSHWHKTRSLSVVTRAGRLEVLGAPTGILNRLR